MNRFDRTHDIRMKSKIEHMLHGITIVLIMAILIELI